MHPPPFTLAFLLARHHRHEIRQGSLENRGAAAHDDLARLSDALGREIRFERIQIRADHLGPLVRDPEQPGEQRGHVLHRLERRGDRMVDTASHLLFHEHGRTVVIGHGRPLAVELRDHLGIRLRTIREFPAHDLGVLAGAGALAGIGRLRIRTEAVQKVLERDHLVDREALARLQIPQESEVVVGQTSHVRLDRPLVRVRLGVAERGVIDLDPAGQGLALAVEDVPALGFATGAVELDTLGLAREPAVTRDGEADVRALGDRIDHHLDHRLAVGADLGRAGLVGVVHQLALGIARRALPGILQHPQELLGLEGAGLHAVDGEDLGAFLGDRHLALGRLLRGLVGLFALLALARLALRRRQVAAADGLDGRRGALRELLGVALEGEADHGGIGIGDLALAQHRGEEHLGGHLGSGLRGIGVHGGEPFRLSVDVLPLSTTPYGDGQFITVRARPVFRSALLLAATLVCRCGDGSLSASRFPSRIPRRASQLEPCHDGHGAACDPGSPRTWHGILHVAQHMPNMMAP